MDNFKELFEASNNVQVNLKTVGEGFRTIHITPSKNRVVMLGGKNVKSGTSFSLANLQVGSSEDVKEELLEFAEMGKPYGEQEIIGLINESVYTLVSIIWKKG
ncbi:MAG: hypothetical protein J7L15_04475 [Clostridiales bacterium]|nr:hypothetical protein [Clostridiales bacterium]